MARGAVRLMRGAVLALLVLAGCESGLEIAGVSQATIARANGHVVVTATLDCMLVRGRPHANDGCDADDTHICVAAAWTGTGAKVAKQCQRIGHVRGATVTFELADLPGAESVVVYTDDQHLAKDPAHQRGVVVSATGSSGR